jgi:hypothetical protein
VNLTLPLPWSAAARTTLLAMLLGSLALAGCGSNVQMSGDGAIVDVDADSAIVTGAAAAARSAPDGRPYQYRAVCLEVGVHTVPVWVMSKWVEDVAVVQELGDYHGNFKWKGHHWVIQRRAKPLAHAEPDPPDSAAAHADTSGTHAASH